MRGNNKTVSEIPLKHCYSQLSGYTWKFGDSKISIKFQTWN